MAVLHQYDYIFAFGVIFASLDAWNIGANDVANSWATSISSRSVTYLQAMILAAIMEFSGGLGVGARVADTIRTKIVKTTLFQDDPALLMLGMLCAVTASSIWLTMATRLGMPVSTTHSIMGGVIGMGVAALGANGVSWVPSGSGADIINGGVVSVILAWIIAPGLAGCFASIIFLISKVLVLARKEPVVRAFILVPFWFGTTGSLLTMLLLTKGGSIKSTLSDQETSGVIVGVGASVMLLCVIFFLPWLWRIIIHNDWKLKWYHIPLGPLLLRRGDVGPPPENFKIMRDFYEGHLTTEQLAEKRGHPVPTADDVVLAESGASNIPTGPLATKTGNGEDSSGHNITCDTDINKAENTTLNGTRVQRTGIIGPKPASAWYTPAGLFWCLKWALFQGVDIDVVSMQKAGGSGAGDKRNLLAGDLEEMHARSQHFDNRIEYMFSMLQVMTASIASFTHGANDLANAVGPFATIFQVWDTGAIPKVNGKDQAEVPTWILAFGGVCLVIGLWTYGYNIVMNLGNKLTLHSPSRGFSMELGAAITVILATKYGLPVSTTQCITGATVGVGFCNGDWRAINWRMVAFIYFGWIITLPMAGIISGCFMGFIINAPRWGLRD